MKLLPTNDFFLRAHYITLPQVVLLKLMFLFLWTQRGLFVSLHWTKESFSLEPVQQLLNDMLLLQFYFQACLFFRRYYFHSWVSNHISCLQWTLLNCKPVQCKSLKKPAKSIQFPLAFKRFVAVKLHKVSSPPFPAGRYFTKKELRFFLPELAYPLLKPTSFQECIPNTFKLSYSCFDCSRLPASFGRKLSLNKGERSRNPRNFSTKQREQGEAKLLYCLKRKSFFDAHYFFFVAWSV